MYPEDCCYSSIFEKLLEMTDDGFIVVDRKGTIININDNYSKFLKTTREFAVGKSILQFIPNSKMLDIMDNKYTEEGVIHEYQDGTTEEKRVIVSRSFVEDENHEVIAGVAQVKFKLESLDVTNKLIHQYSTLNYYKEQYLALKENSYEFKHIIGLDPYFLAQKQRAAQISKNDFALLLTGETGTGKEVFTRAIHNCSNRREHPMISINCAAIPQDLLESELFGYEEGAFTGAKKGGKKGKFELANKGTLFLDEIGDMPLFMQAKLLRVLEDKKIDRLGGTAPIPVDIRLICATRKDLYQMVKAGTFREDLFYRINVVNLEMIPLRNRRDDIIYLAQYFLDRLNHDYRSDVSLKDDVKIALYSYSWPGNIRELDNIIKSAYAVCNGEEILTHDLPIRIAQEYMGGKKEVVCMGYHESIENFERNLICNVLRQYHGKVQNAACLLKINRSLLYKKIQKYNICVSKFREL